MDEESMKVGLLLETAQTHQNLIEALIEKLKEHTQGLDAVVRDGIRRAFVEELKSLYTESQRAVEALQRVRRAANLRSTLWAFGLAAIVLSVALGVAWWVLPTPGEIANLRAQRDELASNIQQLTERGAKVDLRRCSQHLCVRVDLKAPRYGESSDYLVIKGY